MITKQMRQDIERLLDISEKTNIDDINLKIGINFRNFRGEFYVVQEKSLVKILDVIHHSTIKTKLNKLGYKTIRSSKDDKWYFACEKIVEDYGNDNGILELDREINKLESELGKLGKSLYKGSDKLCRLLNLRKIYNIRKGDKDSLLLDDNYVGQFKFCTISIYEEIRLGFKLLFDNI